MFLPFLCYFVFHGLVNFVLYLFFDVVFSFLLQVANPVDLTTIEVSIDSNILNTAADGVLFQQQYTTPDLSDLPNVIRDACCSQNPIAFLQTSNVFCRAAAQACHVRGLLCICLGHLFFVFIITVGIFFLFSCLF